jgi:integrase
MRRRAPGVTESQKRTPVVRLKGRILAHVRRWHRLDKPAPDDPIVAYEGAPVIKLRRSWAAAIRRSGLQGKVTPHTLRHTRATWLMRDGVSLWDAAGQLGMSAIMIERTYGHHHPNYQA